MWYSFFPIIKRNLSSSLCPHSIYNLLILCIWYNIWLYYCIHNSHYFYSILSLCIHLHLLLLLSHLLRKQLISHLHTVGHVHQYIIFLSRWILSILIWRFPMILRILEFLYHGSNIGSLHALSLQKRKKRLLGKNEWGKGEKTKERWMSGKKGKVHVLYIFFWVFFWNLQENHWHLVRNPLRSFSYVTGFLPMLYLVV